MGNKTLVLSRKHGESVVFKVSGPCEFRITLSSRDKAALHRLVIQAPLAVHAVRSELLQGTVAADMLASIESKKGEETRAQAA